MLPLNERPRLFPSKGGMLGGILIVVLLAALTVWVALLARNTAREYAYIGVPADVRNTITVNGRGEVTAIPDIAAISLGTTIEKKTVAAAQEENTRIMNLLHQSLADNGIAKEDIKTTNYNIYPQYDWVPDSGRQVLRGYTVAQNVSVKVRDLEKVGDILGAAGEIGVNQVGGIDFTIDEPEQLQDDAREKAFLDARNKANVLADLLGVKLRRVAGFSESGSGYPVPMYAYAEKAMGMGGGGDAPVVEPGSTDVVANVSVTYEIE